MANNFETVKGNAASEKFNLIRLEPARAVEGDLTLDSGTTYTATFAFTNISRILVDGVTYTEVNSSPSSGEYSFSESTKLITINLGAALTTQRVICFYYHFYSTDKARVANEDPENTSTTLRGWQPRVASEPTFDFNLKDVTEGFLSTSNSSVRLHNEDSFFEQYLTDNDSFSNKNITIWQGIDTVENIKLVYRGQINRLSIGRKVNIQFFDEYAKLNRQLYSNGTYLNSTYNSTRFSNLHPPKENLPIHKLYAELTTYKVIDEGTASGLHRVDGRRLMEAHCTNFSTTISTSTNREWGTILSEGDYGIQSDTISAVDHTDANFSLLTVGANKPYRIGDTLEVASTKYVRVLYFDDGADQIKTTKDATITTSSSVTRPGISVIVIEQDSVLYYALYGRDYSVSNTGNPNDIIKVTFVNNFEATLGMNALNPDTDTVRFRAWADTGKSLLHGDVVKEFIEESGLTVNTASITQANTDSTVKTNFYIPHYQEQEFKSIAENIEDILKSTLGYIFLNNDLEMGYSLFAAPSSTTEVTDREILLDSFQTNIEYNDVRDSIRPENVHDILELDFSNAGLENTKALYLHEVSKQKSYVHVLADTSRMSTILGLLAERKALYKFRTKIRPDTIIGDEFEIDREDLIGNVGDRDIAIVSVQKKSTEVTLSGYDLLGL